MSKPKVITIGSASFDVFLSGEALRAKRDVRTADYVEQFPLGSKIELEGAVFDTGGTTNAATTFARQGFHTSVVTKISDDFAGKEILRDLKSEGIQTSLISVDLSEHTGYSTILLAPGGERSILTYRGVSDNLSADAININRLECSGLYISSLGGNLALLKKLTGPGRHYQVAYNPSGRELEKASALRATLNGVDILCLNKDEAERLFAAKDIKKILKNAAGLCGHVIVTDGPNGSWATDGEHVHQAGIYEDIKAVDRTGAGDAFGAGFAAYLWLGKSVQEAMVFASANATSVTRYVGAKDGILRAHPKIKSMKIQTTKL